MKGFSREDQRVALCGLSCGLCPMRLGGHCPGCGGGAGNQSCKLARCALERGGVEYCFQCADYPCQRYQDFDRYDSFLTHQRRAADLEAAREDLEACHSRLREKEAILAFLLERCNDGRRKSFYCLAVNRLELEDLRPILAQLSQDAPTDPKTRAGTAVQALQEAAERRGIELKLRKRPAKKGKA